MNSPVSSDVRHVTVRLFAAAKERAGSDTIAVRVPPMARIKDLRAAIRETVPALRPLVPQLLFAVGTEYAADDARLPESGEVVAFPPVSGG
jgi:sulfur-carrier protein